ncbi:MAG: hypothetical protein ACOZDY_19745 [Pseudomonadota bacterium]
MRWRLWIFALILACGVAPALAAPSVPLARDLRQAAADVRAGGVVLMVFTLPDCPYCIVAMLGTAGASKP